MLDRFDGFLFVLPGAYYVTYVLEPWTGDSAPDEPSASPSPARRARSAPRPSTSSGPEPDRYEVVALGVGSSVDTLVEQANGVPAARSSPSADPSRRAEVAAALPFATVVDELADLADGADVVVNGVVGFAGLAGHHRHAARRQAARPGQQGEPDRRRAGGAAAAGDPGRRARAG